MSNQDEDEVEDELDALEAEIKGVAALPNPPAKQPELTPEELSKERAKERARVVEESPQPMLA